MQKAGKMEGKMQVTRWKKNKEDVPAKNTFKVIA
jgi:hypothetical protein